MFRLSPHLLHYVLQLQYRVLLFVAIKNCIGMFLHRETECK